MSPVKKSFPLICALLALAVALCVVGTSNCGGNETADAGNEAPPPKDVQRLDVADANQVDVSTDAPYCTPDGGATHDWQGYTRVVALDPCCKIDSADDASASFAAIQWITCKSGRPSCQELNPTWRSDGIQSYFVGFNVTSDATNTPSLLELHIFINSATYGQVIAPFQGSNALASWQIGTGCALAATRPSAGVGQSITLAANASAVPFFRYASGTPQTLTSAPTFTVIPTTTVPANEILQEGTASLSTFAATEAYGGKILRLPMDGGPFATGSIPQDALSVPLIIGNDVIAQSHVANSSGWAREVVVHDDGTTVVLREVVNTNVSDFATDGTNLYWQQTHGGATPGSYQPQGEIWYAPVTTDPTTLANTAQILASPITGGITDNAVAFGGYYAIGDTTSDQGLWIARASDGALQWVPVTVGHKLSTVGYVSSSEIWFVENGSIAEQVGLSLVRIQYAWP